MKKSLLVVLQLVCFLSILNPVHAESDPAVTTVAAINQTWNAAFNKGDMDSLAKLYADDAILSAGDGAVIVGPKNIQALFQSFIDGGFHSHSIETVSAQQEGDTLYQVANWQVIGQDNVLTVGGVLTSIYKRDQQGQWKAVVHTWNTKK